METLNTSGLTLSVVISGLEKYTEYEVGVSAVTVGEGPIASDVVRTDSDGKCTLLYSLVPMPSSLFNVTQ